MNHQWAIVCGSNVPTHYGLASVTTGQSWGRAMLALFTGTHTNKVDKKGRVSVPAPFRATLSKQGFEGAWAVPQFHWRPVY